MWRLFLIERNNCTALTVTPIRYFKGKVAVWPRRAL
jgi:hypothetical protein